MSEGPMNIIVCGRLLGTCEDCQVVELDVEDFINFTPADGVSLPATDNLGVNYISGLITTYLDDVFDIVEIIRDLPRVPDEMID